MNYTLSSNSSIANGTTMRGFMKTTYDNLVSVLGDPRTVKSGDGKVTCEWILVFADGTVATIYDWKTEKTPKEMYYWRVGGKGSDIIKKIETTLNKTHGSN